MFREDVLHYLSVITVALSYCEAHLHTCGSTCKLMQMHSHEYGEKAPKCASWTILNTVYSFHSSRKTRARPPTPTPVKGRRKLNRWEVPGCGGEAALLGYLHDNRAQRVLEVVNPGTPEVSSVYQGEKEEEVGTSGREKMWKETDGEEIPKKTRRDKSSSEEENSWERRGNFSSEKRCSRWDRRVKSTYPLSDIFDCADSRHGHV